MTRGFFLLPVTCLLLAAAPARGQGLVPQPPTPDSRSSLTLSYENDLLGGSDRYYTSGLQLAWRSASANLPAPLEWLDRQLGFVQGPGALRWGLGLGHAIYTPRSTLTTVPDPRDRPYAGHLFGAAVIQRDAGASLSTLELQLGVVGPSALGEFVQNNVHDIIRDDSVNGWDAQLKDEPAVNLTVERIWRSPSLVMPYGLEGDVLPSVSLALGNVHTYAGAGANIRIGQGLKADYGPPRIRPALVGSAFFQPEQDFGWYVFAGGQGRAVARDIFLDGNTWRDSPSVDKRPLVGDLQFGFAVVWRGVRLAYTQVFRSEEFYGQQGAQTFGSLSLSLRF